ncbi:MAG TPA: hypothetical protein VFR90_16520 [Methylibium sp.]|uniref:hypothetical protein n=1 Tax=Methylibium sp. TaxID=2067992 RepID=UPI002DB9A7B6|nr:hypothetical protein [Methylibium sp.]HEU4460726.1 hypothetical protein [Methylibium sp.]
MGELANQYDASLAHFALRRSPKRGSRRQIGEFLAKTISVLFLITAAELFVGGGGRLLDTGAISPRMMLFAIALVASAAYIVLADRIAGGLALGLVLSALFVIVHFPAFVLASVSSVTDEDVFLDLSPISYWLAAPFIAIALMKHDTVAKVATVVRWSAVAMACAYLLTLFAVFVGALNYDTLYTSLNESTEFFFRGGGFLFFKGFLYLGIGAIFILASNSRFKGIMLAIVLAALIMSLTRGLVLATALSAVMFLFAMRKWKLLIILGSFLVVASGFLFVYAPDDGGAELLEQRESSNAVRTDDIKYFNENLDVQTLITGRGFGAALNGRTNVEISYLMIVWKYGLAAMVFWFAPVLLGLYYYSKVRRKDKNFPLATAFMFSTFLVYIQTATNPYLNNPIGLSFVLIAVFALRTLALNTLPPIKRLN